MPCVRWFFAFYFLLFCNAQSGNEMHSLALLAQIRSLALARYVSLFAHQTVLVVCYGANLFALLFLCFAHFFFISLSLSRLFPYLFRFISLVFSLLHLVCSVSIWRSIMLSFACSSLLFHDLSLSLLLSFQLPTLFSPSKLLPHILCVICLNSTPFFI